MVIDGLSEIELRKKCEVMAPAGDALARAVLRLFADRDRHLSKWTDYEQGYILPCFDMAAADGIDLRALVRDNPGNNCVMLYIRALRERIVTLSDSKSIPGES